jgi:hypothetical protein
VTSGYVARLDSLLLTANKVAAYIEGANEGRDSKGAEINKSSIS